MTPQTFTCSYCAFYGTPQTFPTRSALAYHGEQHPINIQEVTE